MKKSCRSADEEEVIPPDKEQFQLQLNVKEIMAAVKKLKNEKVAGIDWTGVNYYKEVRRY